MLTVLTIVALIVIFAVLMYHAPDVIGWLLAIACGVVALAVLAPLIIALLIPMSLFALVVVGLVLFALAVGALLLWPLLFFS